MARKAYRPSRQSEQEIMRTASAMFRARGYQNTTIGDIMDGVGSEKQAFYQCFETKEQLLSELANEWTQVYTEAARIALREKEASFHTKLERVVYIIVHMASRVMEMTAFSHSANEPLRCLLLNRAAESFVPILKDVLTIGVSEKAIRIDNPQFYARFIVYGALHAEEARSHEVVCDDRTRLSRIIDNLLNVCAIEKGGDSVQDFL